MPYLRHGTHSHQSPSAPENSHRLYCQRGPQSRPAAGRGRPLRRGRLGAERLPDADNMRRGNKMARERMTILYDHSARWQALVLGTSNKTELLLGYGTLHGDMASAVNPIGDLYKTQVWALSEYVGVPAEIVSKKPSADLWVGQTDE